MCFEDPASPVVPGCYAVASLPLQIPPRCFATRDRKRFCHSLMNWIDNTSAVCLGIEMDP